MNGAGEPVRRPQRARAHRLTTAAPAPQLVPQTPDPYYGHKDMAILCAAFVSVTFSCLEVPACAATAIPPPPPPPPPPLANFIAYALHRTRLHSYVTFTALHLLARLKARFPAARGRNGHRLFISAFIIASKVVCDDTYSNKSWCVVGQGMFSLKEINQMEREMCSYLGWRLNFDPSELAQFEVHVRRSFAPVPVSESNQSTSTSNSVASMPSLAAPETIYPSPPATPPPPAVRLKSVECY